MEDFSRNRRAVIWFLVATFGVTWALWSVLFLFHIHVHDSRSGDLLITVLGAIGMYVPGLCALAVTRWVLKENWRSTTLDRLGIRSYYLWAWFVPPVLVIATVGLTLLGGGARYDSSLTQLQEAIRASGKAASAMPLRTIMLIQIASAISIGPLINTFFTIGEEVGWRGFLLPRLMRSGMSEGPALVLSGSIWGLWHAPIILRGGEYFGHPYFGVPMFIVFCALLGVVFGWLWLASGSVWVPAVAHASLNAWGGLALILLSHFDMIRWGVINSLTGWIVLTATIGWLAWSKRLPVVLEADR